MVSLANVWQITLVGMGVVLLTLALLAVMVRGLGIALGDAKPTAAKTVDVEGETNDTDQLTEARRAAAIAAVIEFMDRETKALQSVSVVDDIWARQSRVDSVQVRSRFCQGKEYGAWHAHSR